MSSWGSLAVPEMVMVTLAWGFSKRALISSSGLSISPPVSMIFASSMANLRPSALNDPVGTWTVPSAVGASGWRLS